MAKASCLAPFPLFLPPRLPHSHLPPPPSPHRPPARLHPYSLLASLSLHHSFFTAAHISALASSHSYTDCAPTALPASPCRNRNPHAWTSLEQVSLTYHLHGAKPLGRQQTRIRILIPTRAAHKRRRTIARSHVCKRLVTRNITSPLRPPFARTKSGHRDTHHCRASSTKNLPRLRHAASPF